ncbi:MAG TPA: lyase family protein [Gemmatimonadota bacterium]|nr:lyase family protein [Gemmatimonadota bacterium]
MTRTLWRPAGGVDPGMIEYTAGEDRALDARLLPWDILGSLGHVEGLRVSGLLSPGDADLLRAGLRDAIAAAGSGELAIGPEHEDVHTAVEAWLTERLPDAGPRLHTGRSRNDQVACDLRLWTKDALLALHAAAAALADALLDWAERHADALWPGYTHQRRAMVSSAGLWAAAHAEGIVDTLEAFPAVWAPVDRSPLGSAAGYGAPLPLDREAAARALGFAEPEHNVAAVQNGRGKVEAAALFWCVQLGHDLARLSTDAIAFSAEEYGLLHLPPEFATGSSIMPQKQNPDLFELTRARVGAVEGDLAAVLRIRSGLGSGYHRDFQALKEPLFRGLDRTLAMLGMMARAVPRLEVDRERGWELLQGDALVTDEAMRRAEAGTAFREAYAAVAAELAAGARFPAPSPESILARRRSAGGVGDLDLAAPRARLAACRAAAIEGAERFARALERLAGRPVAVPGGGAGLPGASTPPGTPPLGGGDRP